MTNRLFKTTVLTTVLSAVFMTGTVQAALTPAKSTSTPTIRGYAPYLPSVGARYVNKDTTEYTKPLIGDIIEVPTYLIDQNWYTYRDGYAPRSETRPTAETVPPFIGSPDWDEDNVGPFARDREGQYLGQKVSVKWYVIDKKATDKDGKEYIFADEIEGFLDSVKNLKDEALEQAFKDYETNNPTKHIVRTWDDINVLNATGAPADLTDGTDDGIDESYYIPMSNGSNDSLALRIPPEAGNKRVGFIITPESRTGDPARGAPLRVADLNFFWGQKPNTKPGDVCESPLFPNSPNLADPSLCNTNPGTPVEPNPEGPGGVVGLRQYMVNIRWSEDRTGIPKFDDRGQPIDPIVGAHPKAMYPVTNEVYYAEIAILSGGNDNVDPNTPTPFSLPVNNKLYRLLSTTATAGDERGTITWELTKHQFKVVNGVVSTDRTDTEKDPEASLKLNWGENKTSRRFIDLTCDSTLLDEVNAGTKTIQEVAETGGTAENVNGPGGACNPFTDHAFKLQLNNPEAQNYWGSVQGAKSLGTEELANPNFFPEESEQLMSMQVTFQYDDEGLKDGIPADREGNPTTPANP